MSEEQLAGRVRDHLERSASVKRLAADSCTGAIVSAAKMIAQSFASGGKLMLCGNGGSAADCQHVAAEFVSRLSAQLERPGLPAVALTTDTSFLTGYANDYSYDGVFERQVQALGRPGDTLMGISTSGGSRNVLRALSFGKWIGVKTIALMGSRGVLAEVADVIIAVPSENTQHVQEAHLAIEHIICDLVERQLYPERSSEEGS